MEKIIRDALLALGCDDKEIRLFVACYTHGATSLSQLAPLAKLQRSTAYVVMKSLLDKQLVVEDFKAYGKTFVAVPPATLARMVAAKQRQVGRRHVALSENLGELEALYGEADIQPRVKSYQGTNGLLSIWRDILASEGEILIWTNQATESKLFDTAQHSQFIAERKNGNHPARVLTVDNEAGHALRADDAESLRTTKLLPKSVDFSAETYIYGHKVAVLDYNQDIIGVVTESEQFAAAQRAMFETAWELLP